MMRLSLQTLSSIFIMSIPKTDLTALSQLLENGPVEAGLPNHLDDDLLLQLARDLRVVESAYDIGDDAEAPFEAAAFLVFHLMAKCSEKLYGKALTAYLEHKHSGFNTKFFMVVCCWGTCYN